MNSKQSDSKNTKSMHSLTFFNNKGGVGKTTLCCNIASFISCHRSKKLLLVDCDPQCNSTRLILGDDRCEDLYYGGNTGFTADTLLSILKPVIDGDSAINTHITPIEAKDNRFNIYLVPGHPEIAMLEDALSDAWGKVSAGNIEGLRRTHWATFLLKTFSQYDLVFFDVGPSLGALNRSVLLGSQAFLTPMGCDIFSIVGIRNIAQWIGNWNLIYKAGIKNAEMQRRDALKQFDIPTEIAIGHGFIGYTVQQYITKSKGGIRRATRAFEDILELIPTEVKQNLSQFSVPTLSSGSLPLGDVPHLYSLVPLAQSNNAPIHELKSSDGLVGAQSSQALSYTRIIESVADKVLANLSEIS